MKYFKKIQKSNNKDDKYCCLKLQSVNDTIFNGIIKI